MISNNNQSRHLLIGLLGLLIILFWLSFGLGEQGFNGGQIWDLIIGQASASTQLVLLKIRLPRILVCLLAGASLANSGVLLQTLTKNPLADSGILGINAGAGIIIALSIAYGQLDNRSAIALIPLFATLGSLLTVACVYLMARRPLFGIDPNRLIITGVGISTMLSGLMVAIVGKLNRYKVDMMVQWLSGRIQGDDWQTLWLLTPALLLLWWQSYRRSASLNIMTLNDQSAMALGLDLNKERQISLFLATCQAALSVILVGNITFVGLLAANLSKHILGHNHKVTFPASMLIGSIVLLLADTLTRTLLVGTAIPTGLLLSIIGAPYFIWVMRKENN